MLNDQSKNSYTKNLIHFKVLRIFSDRAIIVNPRLIGHYVVISGIYIDLTYPPAESARDTGDTNQSLLGGFFIMASQMK